MSKTATGTMKWEPWKPQPFAEGDGAPMLFRGSVVNHYTGDLTGTSAQECLIHARADGSHPFYALERVTGEIEGRSGSFVLQVNGVVRPGVAEGELTVLEESGTGELAGIAGKGTYRSDNVGPDGHCTYTLEYQLSDL